MRFGNEQRRERINQLRKTNAEAEEREKRKTRLSQNASTYVLTVSAYDYVQSKGKQLQDYNLRLVRGELTYFGIGDNKRELYLSPIEHLLYLGERIGAEAVVGITPTVFYAYPCKNSVVIYATALIPKSKQPEKEDKRPAWSRNTVPCGGGQDEI